MGKISAGSPLGAPRKRSLTQQVKTGSGAGRRQVPSWLSGPAHEGAGAAAVGRSGSLSHQGKRLTGPVWTGPSWQMCLLPEVGLFWSHCHEPRDG